MELTIINVLGWAMLFASVLGLLAAIRLIKQKDTRR